EAVRLQDLEKDKSLLVIDDPDDPEQAELELDERAVAIRAVALEWSAVDLLFETAKNTDTTRLAKLVPTPVLVKLGRDLVQTDVLRGPNGYLVLPVELPEDLPEKKLLSEVKSSVEDSKLSDKIREILVAVAVDRLIQVAQGTQDETTSVPT